MVPLYDALDERLAITLGKSDAGYVEGGYRLVHHQRARRRLWREMDTCKLGDSQQGLS